MPAALPVCVRQHLVVYVLVRAWHVLHHSGVANVEVVIIVVLVVYVIESLLLLSGSAAWLGARAMGIFVSKIRLHFGFCHLRVVLVIVLRLVIRLCLQSLRPISLANPGGVVLSVIILTHEILITNLSCVHVSLRL